MSWRTWHDAMQDALYGAGGFYRRGGVPAGNFRTAAHTGDAWADAIRALAERVDQLLGAPEAFTIVDVGAGGGELLAALSDLTPAHWRLIGVDVAPRPAGLPARVAWSDRLPPEVVGLVVAVELLDVVPVDVAEVTEGGLRLVEVADDGSERLGGPPSPGAADWLRRWWWPADVGDRAEVGGSRDEAWAEVVASVRGGLAVAIDYAADPQRDVAGTLTGYRNGRQVAPVPDGSCDLTAHVLFGSCAAAVDGVETLLLSQRAALEQLGVGARRPVYDGDPVGYLAGLSAAGSAAELLDPHGLGGFTWLAHARGIEMPLQVTGSSAPVQR
jgi:SAM-dependent MidA family methyltransferase